jgi:hypothetical protein
LNLQLNHQLISEDWWQVSFSSESEPYFGVVITVFVFYCSVFALGITVFAYFNRLIQKQTVIGLELAKLIAAIFWISLQAINTDLIVTI